MPVLRPLHGALSLLTLATLAGCAGRPQSRAPDLVIYGRVWTGDSAKPWAGAVAVAGERILAVGDSGSIAKLVGEKTNVIENGKALVAPGFMDGHLHFTDGGFQLA